MQRRLEAQGNGQRNNEAQKDCSKPIALVSSKAFGKDWIIHICLETE